MKVLNSVFFVFLFFFNGFIQPLPAAIIEVDELNKIVKKLPKIDQQTLILLDVDYTLIIPKDAILKPCGQKLARKLVLEILGNNPLNDASKKFANSYYQSQILLQAQSSLVDASFPSFVKQLQSKNIPTIALTAAPTGNFGVINSIENWRIKALKKLKLDFSLAFPKIRILELAKKGDLNSPPLFKSGVLFSSQYTKGETLRRFLDRIQWYPKKVVFVDDRMDFLISVQDVLNEMGIEFIGFYYTAAEKVPCYLDEKIAELQFRHLVEHGIWLSDEKAKSFIRK